MNRLPGNEAKSFIRRLLFQEPMRFLLPMIFLCAPPVALAEVITLRADSWCPYNCDPESDRPGILIEIAKEILGPAGHSIDYRLMPWSRTLNEVLKGNISGAVGVIPSEAPELIYGANPLAYDKPGFAFNKGMEFSYRGPSSLDPFRIAVIRDYHYDDGEIDAYLQAHQTDSTRIQPNAGDNAGMANLKKLLSHRVDLVLDSHDVLAHLVHRHHLGQKVELYAIDRWTGIHIGFSPVKPESRNLANLLSSGIPSLRRQGRLAEIFARYGLSDRQEP
ncbi:MAG: transporter substrate-binding domain-containing protein [Magnetococcales bacterium]|nr:transporter substrate-binding domain-containing protein [Magnetococcales bacterium]